jgi:predicted short-subunit dehydrogenase-like oxidoreductase (DUF2520 family)
MKVSVIGIGRLGGALALALSEKGYEVENLLARRPTAAEKIAAATGSKILSPAEAEKISSELILIATQDTEIEAAAGELARRLKTAPIVLHTSGSLSSNVLQSLKDAGCPVGSLHPLVSISDACLGRTRFRNAFFCIEGDERAVEAARRIALDLGGNPFSIETQYKALYHASAVTSSGHVVALIDAAVEMLARCGLDAAQAKRILLPLIESTVDNLREQTPAEALTGTFARLDGETFERHLASMEKEMRPEIREIYLLLGERSLELAARRGADAERLKNMREKILLAKKKLRC